MTSRMLIELTPGIVISPSDIVAVEELTTDNLDRPHHHASIYLTGGHTITVPLKVSYRFQDLMTSLFDLAPEDESEPNDN